MLAHALSGLVLTLDTMELLGGQPGSGPATMERMIEQVSRAQRIARDGLDDTRRAIAALRGDALPGPALLDRLVVDDQTIVREGLVSLLSLLPGIEVVGAAVDGDDAIRQTWATDPDVVLMDLNMPRCNGVEATERLRGERPQTRAVVLTTYSDDAWVFSALQAGARGFLTKDAGAAEIHRAITTVAAGHAQLDPRCRAGCLTRCATGSSSRSAPRRPSRSRPPLPDDLTPREAEVLTRIAAGLSNQEIATVLFVSEATVKTHINHIFTKTGLRDRAQLVGYAFRQGLAALD